jgi:hypothetical protein
MYINTTALNADTCVELNGDNGFNTTSSACTEWDLAPNKCQVCPSYYSYYKMMI